MRRTRFEIMNELRIILGQTEQTEILIEWLQDVWQTYAALIEHVGEKRAYHFINAMDLFPGVDTHRDLTSYDPSYDQMDQCLLN